MGDEKKLVDFVCDKCGKYLCSTVNTAQVYCPKCKKWVKNEKN